MREVSGPSSIFRAEPALRFPTTAISREEGRERHTAERGHEQFSDTVYGVICAACQNYILIANTNCPPTCREHETCRQACA